MTGPSTRRCRAVLNIAGAHYRCEVEAPHPGIAHDNQEAQAIWCSDGEARKYSKPSGNRTPTTPQKEVEQ